MAFTRYKLPQFSQAFGASKGELFADQSGFFTPKTQQDVNDLIAAGAVAESSSGSGTASPASAGSYVLGTLGFIPATNDYAGIMAAYTAAAAQGGGVIQLGPFTYNLGGNSLPISSKIKYQGAGWTLNMPGIPDDGYVTVASGTIINGNGTAPGFVFNAIDGSSAYATSALFNAASAQECGADNIAFTNCTYGMKIGSNYNPGAFYSTFTNLVATGCGSWGFWFENCAHCHFDSIYAFGCGGGTAAGLSGQIQIRASCTSAILQPANNTIGYMQGSNSPTVTSPLLVRCVEITCTNGTAGGVNFAGFLQGARFNNPTFTPQACVTNGTTSLQVSDATKFAVDLPITFTAQSSAGLTTGVVYFVTRIIDATHIAIANYAGALPAAEVIMTTGTATIATQGYAPLAVVGYGAPALNNNPELNVAAILDLEGGGTAKLIVQNVATPQTAGMGYVLGTDGTATVSACIRNSQNQYFRDCATLSFDIDGGSVTTNVTGTQTSFVNQYGRFLGTDAVTGQYAFNIAQFVGGSGSVNSGQAWSFYNRQPGGGDFTYPGRALGVHQSYSPSAQSFNVGSSMAGFATFTGTSITTWTWNPNLLSGPNTALQGFRQVFKNNGTAALTVTLSTNDGTFDGMTGGTSLGKSILLSAPTATTTGGSLVIVACQTGASTYQWSIESMINAALV